MDETTWGGSCGKLGYNDGYKKGLEAADKDWRERLGKVLLLTRDMREWIEFALKCCVRGWPHRADKGRKLVQKAIEVGEEGKE